MSFLILFKFRALFQISFLKRTEGGVNIFINSFIRNDGGLKSWKILVSGSSQ